MEPTQELRNQLLDIVEACSRHHAGNGEPMPAAEAYAELAQRGLHQLCLDAARGGVREDAASPYWGCELLGRLLPLRLERHGYAEFAVQSAALIESAQGQRVAELVDSFSSGAVVASACTDVGEPAASTRLWMEDGHWHVAGTRRLGDAAQQA